LHNHQIIKILKGDLD